MKGGGEFSLPDPISCSGYLHSWHGYAFANTILSDKTSFSVSVQRFNGEKYKKVRKDTIRSSSTSNNWTLFNKEINKNVYVESGDMIMVSVLDSCQNVTKKRFECPLIPVVITNDSNYYTSNCSTNKTSEQTYMRFLLSASISSTQRGIIC